MTPTATKTKSGNPLIVDGDFQLNTRPRKLITLFLVVAVAGVLIYQTWWLFLGAWLTRCDSTCKCSGPIDPAVWERAIRYDPANACYRFTLAQIYNGSTQFLNTARAGEEFKEAARLNPEKAMHWEELARYYEQEKQPSEARKAMEMALQKDPNYAKTHWIAANLYIRMGDLNAADFELRRAADLDPEGYLIQVLDLVWRFYEDPNKIISTHVPNTKASNIAALNYFLGKQSEAGATLAWERLKTFETRPQDRFQYIDFLISVGKPHEAWKVFSQPKTAELFYNGGFENEVMNGGFDWRSLSTENAQSRRDTTVAKEGLASWLVSFAGKENVDYQNLNHWIPTTKGKNYRLSFWMKTEAISTNEGVFVEVEGKHSEPQLGTTYWQQFSITFTALSDLATLRLRRVPSTKFDNLLSGKVWLDGFDVTELP